MVLVSFKIFTCGYSLMQEIRTVGKIHNYMEENRICHPLFLPSQSVQRYFFLYHCGVEEKITTVYALLKLELF
jgi:hypothetical protein